MGIIVKNKFTAGLFDQLNNTFKVLLSENITKWGLCSSLQVKDNSKDLIFPAYINVCKTKTNFLAKLIVVCSFPQIKMSTNQ